MLRRIFVKQPSALSMASSLLLAAVLTAAFAAAPVSAPASPEMGARLADRFGQLDADGDGLVSWEEFHQANPAMPKAAFEAIDKSGDGLISPEEWRDFSVGHMRDARGGMGKAEMPGAKSGQPAAPGASGQPAPGETHGKGGGLLPGLGSDKP